MSWAALRALTDRSRNICGGWAPARWMTLTNASMRSTSAPRTILKILYTPMVLACGNGGTQSFNRCPVGVWLSKRVQQVLYLAPMRPCYHVWWHCLYTLIVQYVWWWSEMVVLKGSGGSRGRPYQKSAYRYYGFRVLERPRTGQREAKTAW